MGPKIERVDIPPTELGEGPHWDENEKCLYFVDLFQGVINQFIPSTGKHTKLKLGDDTVTFIIPVAGKKNQFVIGEGLDIKRIVWDFNSNAITACQILQTIPESKELNRTNDAKCDATGRLWIGTMAKNEHLKTHPENGALYSFTMKEGLVKKLPNIGIGNGIAVALDNSRFFYVDSFKYNYEEYDFDLEKGALGTKRYSFDLKSRNIDGLPDGMCIDEKGNLWVALHEACKIINIDPRSQKVLQTITLGAEQITSMCFGGDNLDVLYVTSGAKYDNPEDRKRVPEAGSLYKISNLGVKGFPGIPFRPCVN